MVMYPNNFFFHYNIFGILYLIDMIEIVNVNIPEYEYEQDEEREEDCHIVHGPEHDKKLATQVGHESYQLQDAQEPKSTQYR